MIIRGSEREAPVTTVNRVAVTTIVSGALGVACAAGVLLTPPIVPATRFSYPFDSTRFVVAQLVFALQHLAMLAGVRGLAALAAPPTLPWRSAMVMAFVGFLLLIACELFGLLAAGVDIDSATAGAVSSSYGLPTVLVGVAFVLAGWMVARRRLLSWGRWLPFAFGMWVFVVLIPALSGSHIAGRLALGGWMVLYLLLGVALLRQSGAHETRRPDVPVREILHTLTKE